MDKDNESYLDELLETFGQEPPYETDRRRKATDRAKSGRNRGSSKNDTIDSLEEEFNLDDLDDSFLADIDIEDLTNPFDEGKKEFDGSEGSVENENIQGTEEESSAVYEPEDSPVDIPESEEVVFSADEKEEIETETVGLSEEDTAASVAEFAEETASEIGEEIGSELGVELGGEIGSELGSEIGTEIGVEIGSEIGIEPGLEVGGEIGADTGVEIGAEQYGMSAEEEQVAEINLEDMGAADNEEILPVISPLEDIGEPEILSEKEVNKKTKGKKAKKEKPSKSGEKGGFAKLFSKLFDNIPLTEEEIAAIPTPEEEEEAKRQKAEEAAKTKEEKKAAAAEAKKKKAEEAKKKAAENKAKKQAKDAENKAKKKEAELKRLRAEALEKPEGKINKVGAAIIFLFFAVAAAIVIVGTSLFSYDISIADATYKFSNRRYTEAYEGIRGLTIKDRDMELHDKIYTVMFVNKQLNSYNNFFAMGDYSNALDSLIKGLKRYDKYIALATQLGIYSDLVYVRGQIMAELLDVYGVTERDALELMDNTDKQGYSESIYTIVSKLDTQAIAEQNKQEEQEFVP